MVKFHNQTHTHPFPFETVTLAYFLRYPNPYSTHVLSTDVVSRHFDADSQTLYTARLHLKRSKIPSAVLKLLPRSWLGASADGDSQSYILERSIVDVRSGVMVTESRNLEFTGILKVVERQLYRRPTADLGTFFRSAYGRVAAPASRAQAEQQQQLGEDVIPGHRGEGEASLRGIFALKTPEWRQLSEPRQGVDEAETEVSTKVELISNLGDSPRKRLWSRSRSTTDTTTPPEEPVQEKKGFFRTWTQGSIQRSIEAIGLGRAQRAVPNSKHGMNIVLARLRQGGLVAVLEGMRVDREMVGLEGVGNYRKRFVGVEEG